MFCNESSEYMTLYGSCKLRPDETAGRCLTEIDGEIYECQTFLAFEGTKEIERVNNMHAFVDQINAVYGNITADKIPEIPELLTPDYVDHTFRRKNDENIIGIAYDTVYIKIALKNRWFRKPIGKVKYKDGELYEKCDE